MSTSLLYHTSQLNGVNYKSTRYENGAVIWVVELKREITRCPLCTSYLHIFKEAKTRRVRTVPIGTKPCFIEIKTHRLECKKCFHRWWPKFPFIAGLRRVTKVFARYLVSMMKLGTIKAVAKFTGVSWDTVKDIHKEHLQKKYKSVEYAKLQYLGIDEFSIKKGRGYMTVVIDLETGQIIHAVEGRDKRSILPFLRKLAKKAVNLVAMAMDMSGSYESAVREVLPKIDVVFDHFHVMALLSKAIDEIRREQQGRCNQVGLRALKGKRFLLLKNFEKLDTTQKSSLVPWQNLEKTWYTFDWIIFATKSPNPLIHKNTLPNELKSKKLIIDLSVPRNVDAKLAKEPDITLLNIDQIDKTLLTRLKQIEHLLVQTESLIENAVNQHFQSFILRQIQKELWLAAV